ncbi:MAG: hypothetical protein IPK16_17285 [Anaerolineales bacterium]|nr:hypothetical protein [Anaerolineales bacterium]
MIDSAQAYKVIYPRSAYTLPVDARARKLTFDMTYMHIHLQDGRILSVPLAWIPTLAQATPADPEVSDGWDGRLLYWDPDDGRSTRTSSLPVISPVAPSLKMNDFFRWRS